MAQKNRIQIVNPNKVLTKDQEANKKSYFYLQVQWGWYACKLKEWDPERRAGGQWGAGVGKSKGEVEKEDSRIPRDR